MRILILTRKGNNSPTILAQSLKLQLEKLGAEVEISDQINLLNRLVSFRESKLNYHFWLKEKLCNFLNDRKVIRKIKLCDAIIISECIPNAFWRRLYNVEKLKRLYKKPVLLYEVFALHNTPTQIERLADCNDFGVERYDGHLCISDITEIKSEPIQAVFPIGIWAKSWELKPESKQNMLAIVDFPQPGYEDFRDVQLKALKQSGIDYISLERKYSIQEIRKIYSSGAIFFVQFPEAFGLPILECLCAGVQIFTPSSAWPMSWRLNPNPQIHGDGHLPDCFTVYSDESDLVEKLIKFKNEYSLTDTPRKVFQNFVTNYRHFYEGDDVELKRCLNEIRKINA